jgi:DNA-binding NtrC family response regulator
MDERKTTRSSGLARSGDAESGSYFLVIEGNTSSVFPLSKEGVVSVGRGEEAQLRLSDDSVSRLHARVFISELEVRVADLDSKNGVQVNGERIRETQTLVSGDVVSIGDATLVLRRPPRGPSQREVLDERSWRRRLEEEIARANDQQRPLTVVVISPGSPANEATSPSQAVESAVRLIDVVGIDEQKQLLVLLLEMAPDAADRAASHLISTMRSSFPSLRAGLAHWPTDGWDAETLLDAARAARIGATAGGIQQATQTCQELQVGDRRILVVDPAMERVYNLIRRLAQNELSVLIVGETGAGKEHAAFAVHCWSQRSAGLFVPLNCAALTDSIADSELFGHKKGSFTGPTSDKMGLLENGAGGTVFLDEIAELSMAIQAKLLRAIETRRIRRVGETKEREIDVRLVAATNRNLEDEVKAGRFREDLYYRLCVAKVEIPPLRDRPREISLLARMFLNQARVQQGRQAMALSASAAALLARHAWPGNVRELKNMMEFLAATVDDDVLDVRHLPEPVAAGAPKVLEAVATAPPAPTPPSTPSKFLPLSKEVEQLERTRMEEALEATKGVKAHAAALLGMPIRTFIEKYKRFRFHE